MKYKDFYNLARLFSVYIFLCAVFHGQAATAAEPSKDVEVSVTKKISKNAVSYTYTVKNISAPSIVGISIGDDYYGEPELNEAPVGWIFDESPGKISGPVGWESLVITKEESSFIYLHWNIKDQSYALKPGTVRTGFSVTLNKEDPAYEIGHWRVISNNSTDRVGKLIDLKTK